MQICVEEVHVSVNAAEVSTLCMQLCEVSVGQNTCSVAFATVTGLGAEAKTAEDKDQEGGDE